MQRTQNVQRRRSSWVTASVNQGTVCAFVVGILFGWSFGYWSGRLMAKEELQTIAMEKIRRPTPYGILFRASRDMFAYESPLPWWPPPQAAVDKFARLGPLFDWDVDGQVRLWERFIEAGYVTPSRRPLLQDYGGMFPDLDRVVLYCMVRYMKPRRIVEVGSGESTHVVKAALDDLGGGGTVHTVIEPYRASEVPASVKVLEVEVQTISLDVFDSLAAGDILIIDSSHVIMPYGDTLVELVTILPRLNSGVYVHIHDIFLPFDYQQNWGHKNKVYTEQWAVALMLYGAEREWEVVWGSRIMKVEKASEILKMPSYPLRSGQTEPEGGSLWIKKLGKARRA